MQINIQISRIMDMKIIIYNVSYFPKADDQYQMSSVA